MTREKKLNPHYRGSNYRLHLVVRFYLISHILNCLSRFFLHFFDLEYCLLSHGLFERGTLLTPQEMKEQLIREP